MGDMIAQLQRAKVVCSLDEKVMGDRYVFCCWFRKHEKKRLILKISQVISNFFFTHIEKTWKRQMIDKQYQSPYPEDLEEIEGRIDQLLKDAKQEVIVKKEHFRDSLRRFLEENHCLAIDGYLRFRTQSYRKWLSSIIQEAIDDYLLDREYREFIELLKYFVSIQKSSFLCVHVIHKDRKRFHLLKEDGTPIKVNELDKTFHEMMGQSFSGEDFIVGALISTAPEQVVLHTNSPDENVIRTLLQIFDGRITICTGCPKCFSF